MPKVQVFDYIELMFDYIELMRFCLFSCKAFRHATKPKTQTPPPGDRELYSATDAADCSE